MRRSTLTKTNQYNAQYDWINKNPASAFTQAQNKLSQAIALSNTDQQQSVSYLIQAHDIAVQLFTTQTSSPQLTATLTSISIALATGYAQLNQLSQSVLILNKTATYLVEAVYDAESCQSRNKFYYQCLDLLNHSKGRLLNNIPNNLSANTPQSASSKVSFTSVPSTSNQLH